MSKFSYFVLLAVIVIILPASISTASYADDESVFLSDGIHYRILDDDTVEIASVNGFTEDTLTIPVEVTYLGKVYSVVGIDCSPLYSEIVRIHIPPTVEYISSSLDGFALLESVHVDLENRYFSSIDGVLFNKTCTNIILYPQAKIGSSYVVPTTVTTVDDLAFYNTGIIDLTLPEGLAIIGNHSFHNNDSLTRINHHDGINHIPDSVILIGDMAFDSCSNLGDIMLPTTLRMIGEYAFQGCTSMTSMTIPESVMYIGNGFVNGCTSMHTIGVSERNDRYESRDGVLYMNEQNWTSLHSYPCAYPLDEFIVPNDVNTIETMAFCGSVNLEKVVLPDSMTVVGPYSLYGCRTLVSVYIPDSIMSLETMAFADCESLSEIIGGKNVADLGMMVFYNTGLQDAFIPDSVRTIGMMAFYECDGLKEVVIPENVDSIESGAFGCCFNLGSITILDPDTALYEGSLGIGDWEHSVTVDIHIPEGMVVPDDAFNSYTKPNILVMGEEPYPYENLIGVAICLLVLFIIIRLFREV